MTNKELQDKLKQFPDDAIILTSLELVGHGYCIDSVKYAKPKLKFGKFDDGYGKIYEGLLIDI